MTNENELKVGDIDLKNVIEWQKLTITNRDERIKLLESAIGEFLLESNECILTLNCRNAEKILRNLMESKND